MTAGPSWRRSRRRAFSVFCLLAAAGTLLVGSPAPTWMPSRTLWILLLLAGGLSMIPPWWHLAMGKKR
jgi:hypothetical protein